MRGTWWRLARVALAALVLSTAGLVAPSPASATTATSRGFTGATARSQLKEWFNTPFSFDARAAGQLRGRIRFVTETTARLSALRTVSVGDPRSNAAGAPVQVRVENAAGNATLRVASRPALQIVFEWQPQGDPLVCDVTHFPDMGDDWFRRTDGGGPVRDGVCGAIEVTADDLNPIFEQLGIDLELPEVFDLLQQSFTPGFAGTNTLEESHQLFEIKVCKIVDDFFNLPLGDRCGLQLNAVVSTPLTTLAHRVRLQACTSAFAPESGTEIPCAIAIGGEQHPTFESAVFTYAVPGVCPDRPSRYHLTASNMRWHAVLEDVEIGLTVDFNVRFREEGEGWDVATVAIPGSISLLDQPLPLTVAMFPGSTLLHLGHVTPDDDPPLVVVQPPSSTVDEGSTAVVTATTGDLCTPPEATAVRWTIDGTTVTGRTLQRTYADDLPNPLHAGSVRATDEAGNSAEASFDIRVRNVAPAVGLQVTPATGVRLGSAVQLAAPVSDPGADVLRWTWSFGDGSFAIGDGSDAADRLDDRTKTYGAAGLYPLSVAVHDGTDSSSAGVEVPVYDPASKLVGRSTFRADKSAKGIPHGSAYTIDANVSYPNTGSVPTGSFTVDFSRFVDGQSRASRLQATGFEWLVERPGSTKLQGQATVDGQPGWKFRLELTRDGGTPIGSVATLSVWRPGITTLADPDYRFGGPRDTGNIV